MKTYKGAIYALKAGKWFVFGSNTQGRHGKGAALTARVAFGAVYGQAKGPQGQSYAIVTKDLRKLKHPSVPKETIVEQIRDMYLYALSLPNDEFYVAYQGRVANLNGYTPAEMAAMFREAGPIPENIVFEHHFSELVNQGS